METLGRYRILGEIGRGGCGVVYSALDPGIGRKVAIKTIHTEAEPGLRDSLRERFRREARAAGVLSHPHIVTIHEFDDSGDPIYLVMEFVEGHTLAQRMQNEGALPLEFILSVVRAAAGALDSAHAHNIVHRDVKPANFLITGSDFLKIADFGIAKMFGDISLTNTGMLIGTAHYMSPEQVEGKQVTGRSDQFSLAVIAYEMITARKPFQGDSWASVLHQVMSQDPPPVEQFREGLSNTVTAVLRKAMAKDPAQRYASCAQFADEFTQAVIGTTIERTMSGPIAEALKGPFPPPRPDSSEILPTATMGRPKLEPAPPEKSRSTMLPLIIGACVPIALAGGWFAYRASSHAPQTQAPANVAESKPPAAPEEPPREAPVLKDEPAANPQTSKAAASKTSSPAATPAAPASSSKTPPATSPAATRSAVAPPAPSPAATPPPPSASAAPVVIPAPAVAPVVVPPPAPEPVIAQAPPPPPPPPPKTAPVPEPQSTAPPVPTRPPDADAWDRLRNSSDLRALEQFRQSYPASAFSAEAGARIQQLEWDRAAQANDAKSYRDFLAKYPSGPLPDRAKAELAKLDKAREIATTRRLVNEALNRYRMAFENKDSEALKEVWPDLGRAEQTAFQNFFRIARSIKLQLMPIAEVEVTGDRASVRCRRTMTAADERGAMPAQDQTVQIRLRKSGNVMVIESIEAVK